MKLISAIIFMFAVCMVQASTAQEFSGSITAEGRAFPNDAQFSEQASSSISIALEVEFNYAFKNNARFALVPFLRIDNQDTRRNHFDIRELNYFLFSDGWELRIGISKVFWGATEFIHLVDTINQTDLVENIDEEHKLGQPMVHLAVPGNWGVIEIFALPYFRERTFAGQKGRLRFPVVIDTDKARYESDRKNRHLDAAIRYSHTIGNLDAGVHLFRGTGREPSLLLELNGSSEPVLIPYYEQIYQAGLDLQWVLGGWLFNAELLYRIGGHNKDFLATVGGFEYTIGRLAGTEIDLSILGMLAYDSRGHDATSVYENDIIVGVRLGLNDVASSELLAGLIQSIDSSAQAFRIETSRRIGSKWKASFSFWSFFDIPERDLLYSLKNDDFLQIEMSFYF